LGQVRPGDRGDNLIALRPEARPELILGGDNEASLPRPIRLGLQVVSRLMWKIWNGVLPAPERT